MAAAVAAVAVVTAAAAAAGTSSPLAERGVSPPPAPILHAEKDDDLAKPNYGFEKRQKDLARKKKQEEKRQRKAERKNAETTGDPETSGDSGHGETAPQD